MIFDLRKITKLTFTYSEPLLFLANFWNQLANKPKLLFSQYFQLNNVVQHLSIKRNIVMVQIQAAPITINLVFLVFTL